MSLEMLASGNLMVDPIDRSHRGVSYLGFTVATQINTNDGQEMVWIDAMVSGMLLSRAAKLKKRDGVWLRGLVTLRRYKDKRGTERTAWQMEVNELITHNEVHEA